MIDCPSVRHSMAQRLLQERPAEVSGSLGMCLLQGVTSNAKLDTLRMLLDAGANVGAVFDDDVQPVTHGTTALHHAVYYCVESHMKDADATYSGEKRSDAEAVVRLLIERGRRSTFSRGRASRRSRGVRLTQALRLATSRSRARTPTLPSPSRQSSTTRSRRGMRRGRPSSARNARAPPLILW